ncbi:ubiquitin protein ligase [Aureococcus anophagefferens]|nr:ubiquitin protein ligase [Aureococcus anophagefferens]
MGAARSVLRRATSIRAARARFLLTEEEVEEDAACLEAQRRSIKYCVDNLYYGAPVQLSGVRTPKHHLPSALVAFDAGRRSLGRRFGGGEQLSSFPASCVVSPTGDIIVTRRAAAAADEEARTSAGAGRGRSSARRRFAEVVRAPVSRRWARPSRRRPSLRVTWATRDGDAASELIDKFEVAYRPYLAAAALVASLEPDAAFEFKCRARNNVGWSAWSPARQFRASASPPERPDVPVAGVLRASHRALVAGAGADVQVARADLAYCARRDGPPADGGRSGGGLCDDAPLDGMRRDGGWRVLYAGPLTLPRLRSGAGTNYAFAVAAVNGVAASEPSRRVTAARAVVRVPPALLAAALDEVRSVDRPFYRSLRWILDNDLGDDGGGLDATFSVQRGDVEVDLKERGRSVAVVERNKHEYVFLVARWRARHATAMEMDAPGRRGGGRRRAGSAAALFAGGAGPAVSGRRGVDVGELAAYCLHQGEASRRTTP